MNRILKRMNIDQLLLHKLEKKRIITAKDLLDKNEMQLIQMLDISAEDVHNLILIVSQAITPQIQTALNLYNTNIKDISSLKIFSSIPETRILNGALTELVGPSGVGKSQCCMMLTVLATMKKSLGGLDGSVLYIDTETTFSPTRVAEIAESMFPQEFENSESLHKLMSSIIVYNETTVTNLTKRLSNLQQIVIEKNVKLIILDSVAAPIRLKYDRYNLVERHNSLASIASTLKQLAKIFNIPILVTNQVTTVFNSKFKKNRSSNNKQPQYMDSESNLVAALGVAWAHAVNTRFILEEVQETKRLKISKSPIVKLSAFPYRINSAGLQIIKNQQVLDTLFDGSVINQRIEHY